MKSAKFTIWSCAGFWRFSLLPASMKRLPSAAPSAKNALARKQFYQILTGWREVYESGYTDGEDEDEEQTTFSQISLPDVQKGETLPVTALTITEARPNRQPASPKVL